MVLKIIILRNQKACGFFQQKISHPLSLPCIFRHEHVSFITMFAMCFFLTQGVAELHQDGIRVVGGQAGPVFFDGEREEIS